MKYAMQTRDNARAWINLTKKGLLNSILNKPCLYVLRAFETQIG